MVLGASREEMQPVKRLLELTAINFREDYKFFNIVDLRTAAKLAEWLKEIGLNRILDVGAGLGWWQSALSQNGIYVTAIDNYQFFSNHLASMLNQPYRKERFKQELPTAPKHPIEQERPKAKLEVEVPIYSDVTRPETSSQPTRIFQASITTTMAGKVVQQDWREATLTRQEGHDALLMGNPDHPSFIKALDNWGSEKPVLFVSRDGIEDYCKTARKRCFIRPFGSTPPPQLGGWSDMAGYLKLEIFYWEGADDL